jgi:hypothetical protein
MKKLIPVLIAVFLLTVCLVVVGQTAPPPEASVRQTDLSMTIPDTNQADFAVSSTIPVPGRDRSLNFELSSIDAEEEPLLTYVSSDTVRATESRGRMVNMQGEGSVTKSPDLDGYVCGTEVELTAHPDPGWCFGGWSGDLVSTDNPATIIIDSNKVVTATFEPFPEINSVTLSPDDPAGENLTLSYNLNYEPDEDNTRIRWTRDGQLQSLFNYKKTVTGNFTLPCERWCVAVTPYNACGYGDTVEKCVDIGPCNKPPTATEVTITPVTPTNDDSLELTYVYSDTEDDEERDTQIRWYRNGNLQPAFNDFNTISASEIYPSETWFVIVRPHDGEQYGMPAESNCVLIDDASTINRPPQILTATLNPIEPTSSSDLNLEYEYYDPDDNPEGETSIKWYRNGRYQPYYDDRILIPAGYTRPDDEWYATIQPHDRYEYGIPFKTNIVLVNEPTDNTPPRIANARIKLGQPGEEDNLQLVYDYMDADGDPEGNTMILWYKVENTEMAGQVMKAKNADVEELQVTLQEDYMGLTVIPADIIENGETWFAQIIPHDGEEFGTGTAIHSIEVQGEGQGNSPPEIHNLSLSPPYPGNDDFLSLEYDFQDSDEEDVEGATTIEWTANGSQEDGCAGKTRIPPSKTKINDTWCATVTPHDGTEYGDSVTSNCVTITKDGGGNTLPEVYNTHIEPKRPCSDQNLELHYEYSDLDSDQEGNTQIQWYCDGNLVADFNDRAFIPASEVEPGQSWFVTVRPHDGAEYGTLTQTTSIAINHPPQIENLELLPVQSKNYEGLHLDYDYSDEDNDPFNGLRVRWYSKHEEDSTYEHRSKYDDMQYIPADVTSGGDKWYAVVTPHDGIEYGSEVTTDIASVEGDDHHGIFLPLVCWFCTDDGWDQFCEENDTQGRACPRLKFDHYQKAHPDDKNDWYVVGLGRTSSLTIIVNDYLPEVESRTNGQLVLYESLDILSLMARWQEKVHFPKEVSAMDYVEVTPCKASRCCVGNDGEGKHRMEVSTGSKILPPGFYFIRVYNPEKSEYSDDSVYTVYSTYNPWGTHKGR